MSNQVALVAGGASGIGKPVAQNLTSRGIAAVISGRRQEAGDAAVAEISAFAKNGAQLRPVRNDVANEAAVKAMVDGIISEFGRLTNPWRWISRAVRITVRWSIPILWACTIA